MVVNFYPEADNFGESLSALRKILISLNSFLNNTIIFTFPTHEAGKKNLFKKLKNFVKEKKIVTYFII